MLETPGEAFQLRHFPVSPPEPGGAVVRTTCCTICGSDVHAWTGARRPAFLPAILGHEVAGVVSAVGAGTTAADGGELQPGDRVTFTLTASCGRCYYCRQAGLPQKCGSLFKYGHTRCDGPRALTGGLSEQIEVVPGTTIFRIPAGVSDSVAATAMCAGATLAHAFEGIVATHSGSVLLMGVGMLGLWGIRFARSLGVDTVICCDADESRLDYASQCGATEVVSAGDGGRLRELVDSRTEGRGADLCLDLTGQTEAIRAGLGALRTGGVLKLVGSVVPAEDMSVDPFDVVTQARTIQGIHNYRPEHLGQALELVANPEHHGAVLGGVGLRYSLAEVDTAFRDAHDRAAHRVCIDFRGG